MTLSERAVGERELGQIGVSIGTSLALEGAFGIYPDRPESPPPILKYNQLWINVSTIFRNLFGSLSSDAKDSVLSRDMISALVTEMSVVQAAVANVAGVKVKVVFYYNDMSTIGKNLFPNANLKLPSTPKQTIYVALHNQTIKGMTEQISLDEIDYRTFSVKLFGEGRVLILTHSPIDLLSQYRFDDLALLESHTGKIKSKSQWGSKLGVDEVNLPFNTFTIQVFGDGGHFISPKPIKYKRAVLELARKDRWSPVTTINRIKMSLATIKDLEIRDDLLELTKDQSF